MGILNLRFYLFIQWLAFNINQISIYDNFQANFGENQSLRIYERHMLRTALHNMCSLAHEHTFYNGFIYA